MGGGAEGWGDILGGFSVEKMGEWGDEIRCLIGDGRFRDAGGRQNLLAAAMVGGEGVRVVGIGTWAARRVSWGRGRLKPLKLRKRTEGCHVRKSGEMLVDGNTYSSASNGPLVERLAKGAGRIVNSV